MWRSLPLEQSFDHATRRAASVDQRRRGSIRPTPWRAKGDVRLVAQSKPDLARLDAVGEASAAAVADAGKSEVGDQHLRDCRTRPRRLA
jgi:hypothetical protein